MTTRKDIEEAAKAHALHAYGYHVDDEDDRRNGAFDFLAGTDFMQPEIEAARLEGIREGFEAAEEIITRMEIVGENTGQECQAQIVEEYKYKTPDDFIATLKKEKL